MKYRSSMEREEVKRTVEKLGTSRGNLIKSTINRVVEIASKTPLPSCSPSRFRTFYTVRFRLDIVCYKLIFGTSFTRGLGYPHDSYLHVHLIIAAIGQSFFCPLLGCRISEHKLLLQQAKGKDRPSCLAFSLSMKLSYKRVNQKCDCDEIFATYPLAFDLPVNYSTGESSATEWG